MALIFPKHARLASLAMSKRQPLLVIGAESRGFREREAYLASARNVISNGSSLSVVRGSALRNGSIPITRAGLDVPFEKGIDIKYATHVAKTDSDNFRALGLGRSLTTRIARFHIGGQALGSFSSLCRATKLPSLARLCEIGWNGRMCCGVAGMRIDRVKNE